MNPQQLFGQLEALKHKLRASIHQLRGEVIRNERVIGGEHVLVGLRDAIRTREAELERVELDLHRARQPRPVRIPVEQRATETDGRWLKRARREVVLRRDQRHEQHKQSVERELGPYAEAPTEHRTAIYNNVFGPSEHVRHRADTTDAEVLAEIDRRLAALEAEAIAS